MPLTFKQTGAMTRARSRWFLVGENGSGKTSAAATFPDPVFLVYNGENSMETLRSRKLDVPFLEVGGEGIIPQVNNVLNELLAIQKRDPNSLPGQTFVWESLTHFSSAIVDDLSKGGGQMDQRSWGVLASFFAHAQQVLWQLDMNIVFTSYPHYKLNQKQEIIWAGPRIQGSAAETLPGACDHHGYCEVLPGDGQKRADVHRIFFKRYNNYPARTRSSTLPREILNFKYDEIERFI